MLKNKSQKNISDGWIELSLGDIGEFKNGINKDKKDFGFGYPFVNLMNIFGKPIIKRQNFELVNASQGDLKNYNLQKGDVLFVRSSVKKAGVGLTTLVDEDLDETVYSGFIIRFREKGKFFIHGYKKYCFSGKIFRDLLISKSSMSANTNINQEALKQIKIKIPKDKKEQNRIIEILESWDGYLEKLGRKIEVKKNIKKGLMRKLLSGEIRVNGFTEEWRAVKLSNICGRIRTGKLDANAMIKDGKYRFYTCAKDYYKIDKYDFDTEALLISGNGANVGYIHYYKGKFNAYQRTYILDDFKSNIFFTKYLLDKNLKKRIYLEKCDGNTPYIKMNTLTDMIIKIPEFKEQTAIAEILTAADEEIEALAKKKRIIEAQKKFLLNNLVTGKIRVV